jgi:hypothetical protein
LIVEGGKYLKLFLCKSKCSETGYVIDSHFERQSKTKFLAILYSPLKKREEVYGVYKMVTLFYKKVCTKIGLSQKPSHHQLWRIFCVLPLIYLQWKKILLFFFFLLLFEFPVKSGL